MLPTEKLLLERISRPQTKSSLLAALASATPHTQSRTPPPNITKSKLSRTPQSLHCQKSTEPISSKTTPRLCHRAAAAAAPSRYFPGKYSSSPSLPGTRAGPAPFQVPVDPRLPAGWPGRRDKLWDALQALGKRPRSCPAPLFMWLHGGTLAGGKGRRGSLQGAGQGQQDAYLGRGVGLVRV